MEGGMNGAAQAPQGLSDAEMFRAALRGETHGGGSQVFAGIAAQASGTGLNPTDSVSISPEAQALAAAAADTE